MCPYSLWAAGWGDQPNDQREYRSHFGSRYKLGCCDHASLLVRGSIPPGGLKGVKVLPNSFCAFPLSRGGDFWGTFFRKLEILVSSIIRFRI